MTHESERASDMTNVTDLERVFDLARQNQPRVTEGLRERIMADAAAQVAPNVMPTDEPVSIFDHLRAVLKPIGGWGVATAMASAVVAGMWIGFNPPGSFAEAGLFYDETDLYLSDVFADLSFLSGEM